MAVMYQPVPSSQGIRLLLVEDSDAIVDRVLELLERQLPIEHVATVDNESDALSAEGPWDVVILDVGLKEGSGFAVLRTLRRRPGPQPFVVMLTNYGRPEFRALANSFGAQEFLNKTTDFDRLPDVLRPVAMKRFH
jgi:two-component system, OmpR family, response regulator